MKMIGALAGLAIGLASLACGSAGDQKTTDTLMDDTGGSLGFAPGTGGAGGEEANAGGAAGEEMTAAGGSANTGAGGEMAAAGGASAGTGGAMLETGGVGTGGAEMSSGGTSAAGGASTGGAPATEEWYCTDKLFAATPYSPTPNFSCQCFHQKLSGSNIDNWAPSCTPFKQGQCCTQNATTCRCLPIDAWGGDCNNFMPGPDTKQVDSCPGN